MDSEHRHELAQNDLEKWIAKAQESIGPHLLKIVALVVILLGVYGAFRWSAYASANQRSAAWDKFFSEDYAELIQKQPGTEAARYARLRLAESDLQDAKAAMLERREEATKKFESAHEQLDALIADKESPAPLRRYAMLLKAIALESSGAPMKAIEQFKKLSEQYRDSDEARAAEERVKELEKPSTKEFYAQLLAYKPTPGLKSNEPSIDDLLKGLGGNSNIPIPPPPDIKGKKEGDLPLPNLPMTKPDSAPPGKDLPDDKSKDEKKSADSKPAVKEKDAKVDAKDSAKPPSVDAKKADAKSPTKEPEKKPEPAKKN